MVSSPPPPPHQDQGQDNAGNGAKFSNSSETKNHQDYITEEPNYEEEDEDEEEEEEGGLQFQGNADEVYDDDDGEDDYDYDTDADDTGHMWSGGNEDEGKFPIWFDRRWASDA